MVTTGDGGVSRHRALSHPQQSSLPEQALVVAIVVPVLFYMIVDRGPWRHHISLALSVSPTLTLLYRTS
jgi:hypothetical protein